MRILQTLLVFFLAGLCEIGGGYLIWLWVKDGRSIWFGILGGLILIAYGIIATLQTANFGRVYATYGGIFIIMSIFWAMIFDKFVPDKYDIIGALIILLGVCIIYFMPRN